MIKHCFVLDTVQNDLLNLGEFLSFETKDESGTHNEANEKHDSSSDWESTDSNKEWKLKKTSKKHKKKRKKRSKEKTKEQNTNKKLVATKPNTIWLENTSLGISDAYRKDVHPDENNIEFAGLYKMDIAFFHKPIHLTCLGLGKRQSISLYDRERKRRRKAANKVEVRYFLNFNQADLEEESEQRFSNQVESEHFIPVCRIKTKNDESISDSPVTEYVGAVYLERNKIFSQKLLENPNDVESWLQFVDYQDELVMVGEEEKKLFKSPKAIIDKKISILEKAIVKNVTSSVLHLKYMNLVKDVWSSDKVHEKWKELLVKFPNKNVLWQEYTLFVQSNLLSMKVSKVIAVYRKCFRMLLGIYHGTICTHRPEEDALVDLVVIFIQMVIFLWQAGK